MSIRNLYLLSFYILHKVSFLQNDKKYCIITQKLLTAGVISVVAQMCVRSFLWQHDFLFVEPTSVGVVSELTTALCTSSLSVPGQ